MRLHIYALFTFFFVIVYSTSRSQVVDAAMSSKTNRLPVTEYTSYLQTTVPIGIDSVVHASTNFVRAQNHHVLVFNYDPYYCWFRIIVKNDQSKSRTLMLLMAPVGLYNGQLFQKIDGKWNEVAKAGLKYKFEDRTYQFTHHVFPFTLSSGATDTLYLSLDASNVYKSFGFALIQPKELKIFENNIYFVFGIIVGLLLLFFVLNIALFLALKEKLHLWYALYIGLLFFIVMKNDQLDQEFLGLDSERAFRMTPYLAIGAFAIVILMHVVQQFLKDTLIHNNILYRLTTILKINVLCSAIVHATVFLAVPHWRVETIVFIWGKNSILLGTIMIIVNGIYCISKKHRGALFVFFGSLVFLIGSVQRLFFPSTLSFLFPPTTFHIGIMMETFIISLGLIARFWQERSAQQDRELAIETQILDDISKEIHDDVLQNLSVINRNLEKLQPENNLSPEERLLNHRKIINKDEVILITKGLLTDVTKELRDLTNIWEPVKGKNMIEDIRKKCDVFNTVGAFLVTVSVEGEPTSMDFKKSVHITRIIQEALNNTLKHAKATEADVLLKFNTRHMEMRIRDNGSGFDPLRVRRGHGLQNIKDRCGKLNATCRYSTKEGTEIHIAVPL